MEPGELSSNCSTSFQKKWVLRIFFKKISGKKDPEPPKFFQQCFLDCYFIWSVLDLDGNPGICLNLCCTITNA